MFARQSYARRDRLIEDKRHDAYHEAGKWPQPTVCINCGALYAHGGRWSWEEAPPGAHRAVCPACRRIADAYPAGTISIKGAFFKQHQEEILNLVRNVGRQEKNERPLERIIAIRRAADHTLVTTTGVHVARRIGEALSRSYKGHLDFQYANGDLNIRVQWER